MTSEERSAYMKDWHRKNPDYAKKNNTTYKMKNEAILKRKLRRAQLKEEATPFTIGEVLDDVPSEVI